MNPKVLFVSSRMAHIENGVARYDEANGRLIQAIQKALPNLGLLCYDAPKAHPLFTCEVKPTALYTMPWVGGYPGAWRHRKVIAETLKAAEAEYDMLIVQWPFHAFWLLPRLRKPTVFHLCADVHAAARNPVKYRGWRAIPARLLAALMMNRLKRAIKNTQGRVVANGAQLTQQLSNFPATTTLSSSIWPNEVLPENAVRQKWEAQSPKVPELLFVGRPTLEKGADTLMAALEILAAEGFPFTMHFVGATQETFQAENPHVALSPTVQKAVSFAGEVPFGPALFAIFDAADVLVLPSRNEGTPRVLIEARARGAVVVATQVGGIPTSVEDLETGLLIPPESPTALAQAIRRVWQEDQLREQLMVKGRQLVSNHTVQDFAQDLLNGLPK